MGLCAGHSILCGRRAGGEIGTTEDGGCTRVGIRNRIRGPGATLSDTIYDQVVRD